jgi:hypothetical protein
MTYNRARGVLIAIFVIGLVAQVAAIALTYRAGAIASGDLLDLIKKLLAVYSVHLAVIFAGIFAQKQRARSARVSGTTFWLAAALALLWNLLLAWRTGVFAAAAYDPEGEDSVAQLSSYIEGVASASSFLVAGALAFFFTKKENE